MKRREDEAIFSDTIILFASFYAFVLTTLQSFLHVKVNIHPVLTGEMRMRQINSHFSKNTLCVLCCAQLLFFYYHFAFKTVDCTIKVSQRVCQSFKAFQPASPPSQESMVVQ